MNIKIKKEELQTGMILVIGGNEWLVMKEFLHGHNITNSEVALNLDNVNSWKKLENIDMSSVTRISRPSHLYGVVRHLIGKEVMKGSKFPYEVCYQEQEDKMITLSNGSKVSMATVEEALKSHVG